MLPQPRCDLMAAGGPAASTLPADLTAPIGHFSLKLGLGDGYEASERSENRAGQQMNALAMSPGVLACSSVLLWEDILVPRDMLANRQRPAPAPSAWVATRRASHNRWPAHLARSAGGT